MNIDDQTEYYSSKEHIGTFVTVFRIIPREMINAVKARGVSVNSELKRRHPVESIFSASAKAHGNLTDRTRCVFAFPRDPRYGSTMPPYDPQHYALVTMRVDPNGAIVTDGDIFTQAGTDFLRGKRNSATRLANLYYDRAIPLAQYMSVQGNDIYGFMYPEVLLPTNVPANRIEVIE